MLLRTLATGDNNEHSLLAGGRTTRRVLCGPADSGDRTVWLEHGIIPLPFVPLNCWAAPRAVPASAILAR
jgi:hypothetical protein